MLWVKQISSPCPEEVLASWGEEVVLPALDVDRAWERADKEEELLGKHLYGIVLPHWAALGPEAHSTSHVVAVKVPGALGIAVHFDDFHLPPGVQMWVTNEAGTWEEGPYDFRDNDDHGRLGHRGRARRISCAAFGHAIWNSRSGSPAHRRSSGLVSRRRWSTWWQSALRGGCSMSRNCRLGVPEGRDRAPFHH